MDHQEDNEFEPESGNNNDTMSASDKSGGTGIANICFRSVTKLFRIACSVPLVCLFVVGLLAVILSVSWQGRFVGLSTVSFSVILFCTLDYWNRPWFQRIRYKFYVSTFSICFLLILVPAISAPTGRSLNAPFRNCYVGGKSDFKRFAPSNILPEVDQVAIVTIAGALFDPHIDFAKAKRIRALTTPVYLEIRQDADFELTGSAMGSAYRELFQMEFQNGHYFLFVPESEDDQPLPCLVYLHGMGGNRKSHFWGLTKMATELKCIVIAPTFGLGNWDKEGGASHVIAVLDDVMESVPIDPENIFLMGYSNGAKGVTRAVVESPKLFKGLIYLSPVTEDDLFTSQEFLAEHQQRKILFLHGDSDSRIPKNYVVDTVEMLQRLGGDVELRMFSGEDHYLILSQSEMISQEISKFITDTR